MWSIALEVQIYVVFALALIPVWRRYGATAQLALAAILSLVPHFLAHGLLDWTCPWMLALFAMGVWAADQTARGPHAKVPWTWLALGATVAGFVLASTGTQYELTDPRSISFLIPDVVVGAAVCLIFVASAVHPGWFVARFLGAPPFQILGTFSYSLYLIHAPSVALIWSVLVLAHASATVWLVTWMCAIPLVLVASYGLYLLAERPFLSSSMRAKLDVVDRRGADVEALAST
jgi:peptidoglycan/LPS O-acetylase OafA/YrhL